MRLVQLHNFLEPYVLEGCVREINDLELKRYDNPFERKWILENKGSIGPNLVSAFTTLKSHEACWWVSKILDVPIDYADYTHFGGVFVYQPEDYLRAHVDAGVYNNYRKIATALIYLTESIVETWNGDDCTRNDAQVWSPTIHVIRPNTCVLFVNDDTAWHGVPVVHTTSRLVLTLSYMALPSSLNTTKQMKNTRTHAYFARQVGEGHELDALRQLRASDQAHKAWVI